MQTFVQIVTIISALVLITLILLQVRGTSNNVLGPSEGSNYRARRGIERILFRSTIACALIFIASALITVIVVNSSP